MEQISVRGVDFDNAESRLAGAARRRGEGFHNLSNPAFIQRRGMRISVRERNGAGRDGRPATFGFRNHSRAFPGAHRAALSSCMRKLNSGDRALFTDETSDACERLDVLVPPNSQIVRADAAFGRYSASFRENQGCSADGAASEMDQMPIRGEAVRARILAHGRNNDSVAQRHFTDLKLVEQMHWDIPLRLDRRRRGPSILSFAPETAIHSSRETITWM